VLHRITWDALLAVGLPRGLKEFAEEASKVAISDKQSTIQKEVPHHATRLRNECTRVTCTTVEATTA